jgi:nitrite reductase/ring-hydroxylating ferredoxin subunit
MPAANLSVAASGPIPRSREVGERDASSESGDDSLYLLEEEGRIFAFDEECSHLRGCHQGDEEGEEGESVAGIALSDLFFSDA